MPEQNETDGQAYEREVSRRLGGLNPFRRRTAHAEGQENPEVA